MKRHKTVLTIFAIILAISTVVTGYCYRYTSNNRQQMNNGNTGFAVVELFTSEGCSSCPPADKAIATLLAKQLENVYILCFHVDYWNRLGWKDPFSQSLYTARQGKYATFFSLNGVYTPQVVINGRSEFVGSDESRLQATVESELRKQGPSDIRISTERTSRTVKVSYTTNQHNALLNLALVQPEATTIVKKGENGGKTLHHVDIVRALHTLEIKGNGSFALEIPKELEGMPLQLIAYTQSRANFKISGADKKNL